MMKIHRIFFGVGLIIILLTGISYNQIPSKYIKLSSYGYSFEVPETWSVANYLEAEKTRKTILSAIKNLPGEFNENLEIDTARFEIPSIFMFSSQKGDCIIMIYLVTLPPQAQMAEWLDILYENNKVKMKLGLKQGIVKEIFRNSKIKINNIPVLISDMEMMRGKLNRMVTYIFHSPRYLKMEFVINFFCDYSGYFRNKTDITHLLNSVKITKHASTD